MSEIECRVEIILLPMMIIHAILKKDVFNVCPKEFGTWWLEVAVIFSILVTLHNNYKQTGNVDGIYSMVIMLTIFYVVYNGIGSYKYIYLLFHDHSCFDKTFFFLMGVNFTFYLIIMVLVLTLVCCEINKARVRGQRVNEVKDEYFVILEKIKDDENFDAEDFINKNKEFIDSVELLEQDKNLLQKYCMIKYHVRDSSTNSDSCSICLIDYTIGEDVMEHPICRHTFHWECLELWLVQYRSCPICRAGSRVNLIRHLATANKEKRELKEFGGEEKKKEKELGDEEGFELKEIGDDQVEVNDGKLSQKNSEHLKEEEKKSVELENEQNLI